MNRKLFFVLFILMISLAAAHEEDTFAMGEEIIKSKIPCSQLSEAQLEAVGEYYMEQMHPGEAHNLMHQMMGLEEGSKVEEQFHINMAKSLYCNENVGGMMGSGGMMGGGMMNMMMGGNMIGLGGMMGNLGYGVGYWNFVNVLYVILLIGLIILVYFWIIKLFRGSKKKR